MLFEHELLSTVYLKSENGMDGCDLNVVALVQITR